MATNSTYSRAECVHFRSLTTVCRAGVDVSTVRDADDRVPCIVIRSITGAHPCEKRMIPVPSLGAETGQMSNMLAAMLAEKCPKCGARIHGETEFNDSILALPCRHVLRGAPGE